MNISLKSTVVFWLLVFFSGNELFAMEPNVPDVSIDTSSLRVHLQNNPIHLFSDHITINTPGATFPNAQFPQATVANNVQYLRVSEQNSWWGDIKLGARKTLIDAILMIAIQLPLQYAIQQAQKSAQSYLQKQDGDGLESADPAVIKELASLNRQNTILQILEKQADESEKRAITAADKQACQETRKNLNAMRAVYVEKLKVLSEKLKQQEEFASAQAPIQQAA